MELSDSTLLAISTNEIDIKQQRERALSDVTGIDSIKEPITYEHFFREYLLPNKPCILGSWATDGWLSRKEWATDENQPDLHFLKEMFGRAKCPVADCKQARYDSHLKTDKSFAEFIDYMETYRIIGYPENKECLYLKDWHFQREFPSYKAYTVPDFFLSDWLNEFWDKRDDVCDDYRFVYIGPKGSWTPFHTDVLKSYSWSANICGRKKWIMYPPGEEEKLKDKLGHLPFDVNSVESLDTDKYPSASKVSKRFEIYQESGEIIFVPSGWYHQVMNVEDTISINHNWTNGCNVDLCWQYLMDSMLAVQKEISDCKDMEGWSDQCQVILKANNGMDYSEFYQFLHIVAENRIKSLQAYLQNDGDTAKEPLEPAEGDAIEHKSKHDKDNRGQDTGSKWEEDIQLSGHSKLYFNHLVFDLIQIKKLVFDMKRNKDFLSLDFDRFQVRPKALISQIERVIDAYLDIMN